MPRTIIAWMLGLGLIAAGCAAADDDDSGPPLDDDDGADDDDAVDDEDDDDIIDDDDDDTVGDDDDDVVVEPPFGESSGGTGGGTCPLGCAEQTDSIQYQLIVPSSYNAALPAELLVVYSGTEGATVMTSNMRQVAAYCGIGDAIIAVLDGQQYYGNGAAGATVLDDVRDRYNVDNDRTWLLSESAGTSAGIQLGFQLRQPYFAAFWANDVNAAGSPAQTAAQMGFAPWGNAGPGGDFVDANAIVDAMDGAGYRLPSDAPYSGTGAGTHGSQDQFLAAVSFFAGKTRQ